MIESTCDWCNARVDVDLMAPIRRLSAIEPGPNERLQRVRLCDDCFDDYRKWLGIHADPLEPVSALEQRAMDGDR